MVEREEQTGMTRVKSILGLFLLVLATACSNIQQERKIEFVYLALGASDVMGVGATPLTEGYAYLVSRDLEEHVPGTFLINLGIPGARIDALTEQVRLAKHFGGEADVATVWVGANDLVHGVGPSRFQSDLRQLLRRLQTSLSKTVVIATLPDLTRLAAFGGTPNPAVTEARVQAFNRAIEVEAPYVGASIVDLFHDTSPDDFAFDEDGFHPTKAGHRRMANLFEKTIFERLGLQSLSNQASP
jgi:lysophospholipase L1-like esterase